MLSRRLAGKKINSTRVCGGIDTRQWFMMKIDTTDKTKCCGCGACVVACPQTCIRLLPDDEGFDYPVIDTGGCIDCGRCLEVCGMQNESQLHEVKDTYAAWHKDPEIRARGTSGSAFSAFADIIFDNGGFVAGAAFAADFKSVKHQVISSMAEIGPLRGSKYVQSETCECFGKVLSSLIKGESVFFSGMPCQVASLKKLAGQHSENLITCDLVCHGVPSPRVFKSYIDEIERKTGKNVTGYFFRDKTWGWHFHHVKMLFDDGSFASQLPWADKYSAGYYQNIFLRPACYTCPYATKSRSGDITLADCWGVSSVNPEYDNNRGTSLLLVNTRKGKELFEQVQKKKALFVGEYDFESACLKNPAFTCSATSNEKRVIFFKRFLETNNFNSASGIYTNGVFIFKQRIRRLLKVLLWTFMKKIR